MLNQFTDSAPVTNIRRTADGYLAGSVRCACVGLQTYTKKELGLGDSGLIVVYRPESAVFDSTSLATYAGKPITVGHPKENVNAANWKDLAVGTLGSKVLRDGESVVVDFSIMDEQTINLVENGTRQISMGYTTPIEMRDGLTPDGEPYQAIQTGPIRINHLAVVAQARGGDKLRFGDQAAQQWGATPYHQELPMTTKPVVLGDAAVQVVIADAVTVETFRDRMAQTIAAKDTEIGGLKVQIKNLEDAAVTPAMLTKMIADRVALEAVVAKTAPQVVCDGLTDAQVRKAVVAAKLTDAAVAEASDDEVKGMFKAIVTSTATAPNDTVRDALRGTNLNDAATGSWNDSVYAAAGLKTKGQK